MNGKIANTNSNCTLLLLTSQMDSENINILLADDDKDDCLFFKEALEDLKLPTQLTAVQDGEQLMHYLAVKSDNLPHVLFLDLNMPRKDGFICLEEIKSSEKLKSLPVIILSTSYDERIADLLYKKGAQHYICKPTDFSQLKKVIHHAIMLTTQSDGKQARTKEAFLLSNLKTIFL